MPPERQQTSVSIQALIIGMHLARSVRGLPGAPPRAA
jgi:hypothetical protein